MCILTDMYLKFQLNTLTKSKRCRWLLNVRCHCSTQQRKAEQSFLLLKAYLNFHLQLVQAVFRFLRSKLENRKVL